MSYFASVQDAGEGTVYAYDGVVWDANMMYGCNCDAGYSGPMCNLRNCAVGDDPLTGTEEVGDYSSSVLCTIVLVIFVRGSNACSHLK